MLVAREPSSLRVVTSRSPVEVLAELLGVSGVPPEVRAPSAPQCPEPRGLFLWRSLHLLLQGHVCRKTWFLIKMTSVSKRRW